MAYNEATVAVRLTFRELVRIVLPMSGWWCKRPETSGILRSMANSDSGFSRRDIVNALAGVTSKSPLPVRADVLWTIRVIGTIALHLSGQPVWPPPRDKQRLDYFGLILDKFVEVMQDLPAGSAAPSVHLVNLNRIASSPVYRSRVAVKADAGTRLFEINCKDITWAVIDSGVDATHPAFRCRDAAGVAEKKLNHGDWSPQTRVLATYDFTLIRDLLSTDRELSPQTATPERREQLKRLAQAVKKTGDEATLRKSIKSGRAVDWPLLASFLRIPHDKDYRPPVHEHGTHVAGILGADWRTNDKPPSPMNEDVRGMCPSINLYDLRVLDDSGSGDEFSIMAGLQFVRYLNAHREIMTIHGVNLSLSIRHSVVNYACGRTPICDESERLVGAGVTVVAAAGNEGYLAKNSDNTFDTYRAISITDPGNAESVITVGATHRDRPHTYGVSYFSSRGPTGDGRIKPDLVAPGEKVESCLPGERWECKDGTSQAAPHVSGAAAMLMARNSELIGQPQRIKQILYRTATDLGREKYFQGCGMLDILRALQSV